MAGGKASPRQKMINMMYLVLTALLALNVSADILLSFQTIANSLRVTSMELKKKNDELGKELNHILAEQKSKGKNANQYLIPFISEVTSKSDDIVRKLEFHIDRIKSDSIAGYDTVKKSLANLGEGTKSYNYWMKGANGKDTDNEGRGAGAAFELRKLLNGHVTWGNDLHYKVKGANLQKEEKLDKDKKIYFELCKDPANDDLVPKSDLKTKPWEYYTFHGAPAISNVAMLEKYKTDVRFMESSLLEYIKTRIVDRPAFIINKLQTVVAPKSEVVLAGMPFEAQVFITMSAAPAADQKKPTFSGKGVKASKDGMTATINLIGDASVIPRGKDAGEQHYSASIMYPKSDGGVEKMEAKGKFTVRKPEVVIGTMVLFPLYFQCMNDLDCDVPALGEKYDPRYEARGGDVQMDKNNRKKLKVVPKEKKFQLVVKNNFNGTIVELDKRDFEVRMPPKPSVQVFLNGKEWTPAMKIGLTDKLKVRIRPDEEFLKALPNDARYRIEALKVLKKCSIGPPEPCKNFPASPVTKRGVQHAEVDVSIAVLPEVQKRCQLIFEIDRVSRVNYEDKASDVPLTGSERVIMGNVE
jgi:gliding motility-associated protein GldM